jgi:glycerophosphoryl diester phosphodiesterase
MRHAVVLFAVSISAFPVVSNAAGERASRSQPLVVAHRGLLRHAPENTLANFRACLELRVGFEMDVQRSQDGHLVCIHDATVDRTTNGQGKVADLTLKQLQQLDAGSWFHAAFRGQRIPTIEEVFALLAAYPRAAVLIAVDLKADDARLEHDVVRLAEKHKVLDRLLFIGRTIGSPDVRQRLRTANAKVHVAKLANTRDEFPAALSAAGADWIYVRYLPSRQEVDRVHKEGKRVFIAGPTVAGRDPVNWQKTADAGVDAVLTDFPLSLRQQQRQSK